MLDGSFKDLRLKIKSIIAELSLMTYG
ncbi:hypothetical protein THOM_0084 [Trachipleistophora hominis]|uniref:Uncharacterized protein n=1 Tax=Trachipleistophora hominis TaxID=72359 RepID=L7JZJ7_TRAHO|nr:hypothetical protein THOM_0084 [Trachipleistophora hominis]